MRRRTFLGSLAAGLPESRAAARDRPNILWLIAEDFCPDLGCYGNRVVRTPNLDRLAAEGVRFDNAFVTGPVCSASRSALATGMYQTSIGAHNHRSHRGDGYRLPDGIEIVTHYFRQGGYFTANVTTAAPGVRGTGKTDFNFLVEKPFDGTDWKERKPGQPFYAQVNFNETHRAFRRFANRPVDPARVEIPPCYPDHPAIRADWAMYLDSAQHLDVKAGKVLERLEREGLRESTIVLFFGDNGQPMPRGKQFLYEGGIHVPLIAWFPERFRPRGARPGSVRRDLVSLIDVTATSLKLAGLEPPRHMQGRVIFGSGATPRDRIFAARDRCDETVDRIRCVRTARFKYIRNYFPDRPWTQQNVYKDTQYPPLQVMRQLREEGKLSGPAAWFMGDERPAEELYDLRTDPHELNNLASSPERRGALAELRASLDAWIKESGDQGETPEPSLPEEERFRVEVDGWTSSGGRALVSRDAGALRIECRGKNTQLIRSYVTEGGAMELRFRVRSNDARLRSAGFGSIEEIAGSPKTRFPVDFTAGEWREYRVPFRAEGFLARLIFDFGDAEGPAEFEWIRLHRDGRPLATWDFGRWTALFDGATLAGWHVAARPEDIDKNFWTVRDGAITCDSRGRKDHDYVWLLSDAEYGDFELKLKVRGFAESTGNSGVQVRSRYDRAAFWLDGPQVDIHPPGPWRTGLIYDETRGTRRWVFPSLPDWNIEPRQGPQQWTWKQNGWNDVEIVCLGAAMRTAVNGIRIADFNGSGILDDANHGARNVGLRGHIGLQLHARDEMLIQYKDLFIRALA